MAYQTDHIDVSSKRQMPCMVLRKYINSSSRRHEMKAIEIFMIKTNLQNAPCRPNWACLLQI